MLKQITQGLRTAATLGAATLALVACGGGENLALNPPSDEPTVTAVTVTKIVADGFGDSTGTEKASSSFTDTTGKAPWNLTGTRSATAVGYSTLRGVLESKAPTGDKAKTSLGFTLASTQNQTILVRIKASAGDECSPSFVAQITSTNSGNFTVPLSDFKRANDPSGDSTRSYAACDATNNPGNAVDMATFYGIEINDRKTTTGTTATGTTAINVTLTNLNWVVAP